MMILNLLNIFFNKVIVIGIVICTCLTYEAITQTTVEYNKTLQKDQGVLRLYDFAIKHSLSLIDITIEFTIKDNSNKIIFNGYSKAFTLRPGLNFLNYGLISPLSILTGTDNTAFELENGTYTYIIKIIDFKTNQLIVSHTEPGIVVDNRRENLKKESNAHSKLTIGSTLRYSDQPFYGQDEESTAQYMTSINSSSSILGVPIKANITFSNSTIPIERALKKISLAIDVKEIARRRKEKLINELKSQSNISNDSNKLKSLVPVKEVLINDKYPQISKLRAKVSGFDPNNLNTFKLEHDKITSSLNCNQYTHVEQKLDSLLKKNRISNIHEFKDSALIFKEDSLSDLKKVLCLKIKKDSLLNQKKILEEKILTFRSDFETLKEVKRIENSKLENLLNSKSYNKLTQLFPMLNKKNSIIDGIESFSIGTFYPKINSLSVCGIQLDGVECSYLSSNNIFGQITIGRVNRTFDLLSNKESLSNYTRMLYAFVIGYGSEEDNYLHVNYVIFGDNRKSNQNTEEKYHAKLAENFLFGMDYCKSALSQKITFNTSIYTSLYIPDKSLPIREIQNTEILLIPFVKNRVRESSKIGFAGKVEFLYNCAERNIKTTAIVDYFSPGYFSLGLPLNYNNTTKYKIKIDKYYFKKKLGISTFYIKETHPLSILNNIIYQVNTNFGVSVNLRLPRKPNFIIEYYPYFKRETGLVFDVNTTRTQAYNHIICIQSGYENSRGSINNSVSAFTYYQITKFSRQSDFQLMQISLSDVMSYRKIGGVVKIIISPYSTNDLTFSSQKSYSFSFIYKPVSWVLESSIIYNYQDCVGKYYSYKFSSNCSYKRWLQLNISAQYNEKTWTLENYKSPKYQVITSLYISI